MNIPATKRHLITSKVQIVIWKDLCNLSKKVLKENIVRINCWIYWPKRPRKNKQSVSNKTTRCTLPKTNWLAKPRNASLSTNFQNVALLCVMNTYSPVHNRRVGGIKQGVGKILKYKRGCSKWGLVKCCM